MSEDNRQKRPIDQQDVLEAGESVRIAEEQERRIRVSAEGRSWARQEASAAFRPILFRTLEELTVAASRGPLNRHQVNQLKALARYIPEAKEILERCQQMTPAEQRRIRREELKSRKERHQAQEMEIVAGRIKRIKLAAEQGPLTWRDVQILGAIDDPESAAARDGDEGLLRLDDPRFAAIRAEAKELLRKYEKDALPRPQTL